MVDLFIIIYLSVPIRTRAIQSFMACVRHHISCHDFSRPRINLTWRSIRRHHVTWRDPTQGFTLFFQGFSHPPKNNIDPAKYRNWSLATFFIHGWCLLEELNFKEKSCLRWRWIASEPGRKNLEKMPYLMVYHMTIQTVHYHLQYHLPYHHIASKHSLLEYMVHIISPLIINECHKLLNRLYGVIYMAIAYSCIFKSLLYGF